MHVAIVLFDGFDNLDAIGPFESRSTVRRRPRCGAIHTGRQSVAVSSHGLRIEPDGQLPVDSDLVVVPGGGWGTRAESGVMDEMAYERRGKVHR